MPNTTARSNRTSTPAPTDPQAPPTVEHPSEHPPVRRLRIDGEHSTNRVVEASGEPDVPDVDQLDRTQLAQLAQRLLAKHEQLVQQQEEMNAALAEFDRERRKERMKFQEERVHLEELASELQAKREELTHSKGELTAREVALKQREQQLEEIAAALEKSRQAGVEEWQGTRQQLEARIADLEQRLVIERNQREQAQALWRTKSKDDEQQQARMHRLAAVERTLKEQVAELVREKERFNVRCAQWEERLRRRREVWSRKWASQRRNIMQWRKRLQAQSDDLESRESVLERLEDELHQFHANVLKQRLALEAAWERFQDHTPSIEQTRLVATLRSKLDDEWHWNTQQQQLQRAELEELLQRVEIRSTELADRRQALVQWFRRREEELAERTEKLAEQQRQVENHCEQMRQAVDEAEARCHRAEAQLRTWVAREYDAA